MAYQKTGSSYRPAKDIASGRYLTATVNCEVPSSSVGRIIGAGGKQLRTIEQRAGLDKFSIHISPSKTASGMQTVSIKGQQRNCEAAKCKIEEIAGLPMKKHNLTEFEVPSSSLGLIIGAKGKQLRKLEEEAQLEKFSIEVSYDESSPGMQMVSIKGPQRNREAAKRKIEELAEMSTEREHHDWRESRHNKMGQSAGARTKDKQLFFFTFLEDSNEVVFNFYKGIPPSNWREDDMYYLEACPQETSVMSPLKDLHHSLRNYSRLQKSLHAAMEECLSSDPVYLRIEARFGKVLWRADGQNCVSDEVRSRRYRIKDLEQGGEVSVEDVLGRRGIRRDFRTLLSDTTIPDFVKAAGCPEIGCTDRIDITIHLADDEYMIRMEQKGENFEILEVHLAGNNKSYKFDCLNVERDLDMRIATICVPEDAKPEVEPEMRKTAEELCHGMTLRDGCLYVKDLPGCSIEYARRGKFTMYLVAHQDKVHGECPYILAHYHVEDCLYPEKCTSATGDNEVKLQFKNEHHEVELWNCQWMADFAVLVGKTPEEVFIRKFCDPSMIKVRPKDRRKLTADSVIGELDPFIVCALEMASINRDEL